MALRYCSRGVAGETTFQRENTKSPRRCLLGVPGNDSLAILPGETGAQICRLTGAFRLQCFPFRRLRSFLQQRHAEQYGHLDRTIIIGSICPGISETVPDFCILSLVPEGHTICAVGQTSIRWHCTHSASYHQLLGCVSLDSDSACNLYKRIYTNVTRMRGEPLSG